MDTMHALSLYYEYIEKHLQRIYIGHLGIRDSSFGIETGYELDDREVGVRIR
jgi:hypothetical protein